MCGESWLATKEPTAPVLKGGHPGVPCYICLVCLGHGWVGYLSYFHTLVC